MAGLSGRGGKVDWDTAGHVNELGGWSIDQTIGEVDDTVMSNGATEVWGTQLTTVKRWNATIDVNMDPTDSDGQEAMTIGARATFKLYPQGDASGKKYWSGTADIMGIGDAGVVDGKLTRKITVKGYGALSRSTV